MRNGQASRTAVGAARHRAVHQVLEGGRIFFDPLAWQILGEHPGPTVEAAQQDPHSRRLRLFIAARHRFAEDCLISAVDHGTRQVVVLGAGLDTFAYRAPLAGLVVFEVDHPDTGEWKRRRLEESGIGVPANVEYVPVDFETDDFMDALARRGFDLAEPAFFMWLGVVPYLTLSAITATLRGIAGVADAEVVFDYTAQISNPSGAAARARDELRSRTAAVGEPLRDPMNTDQLQTLLSATGFIEIEDLGSSDIRSRIFGIIGGGDHGGGHLVRAISATCGSQN